MIYSSWTLKEVPSFSFHFCFSYGPKCVDRQLMTSKAQTIPAQLLTPCAKVQLLPGAIQPGESKAKLRAKKGENGRK